MMKIHLGLHFLFAVIALNALGPASCSSYLDDYFLPTAKLALNKIQQSLTPTASSIPTQRVDTNESSIAVDRQANTNAQDIQSSNDKMQAQQTEQAKIPASATTMTTTPLITAIKMPDEPPNRNEFIRLDTGQLPTGILSPAVAEEAQTEGQQVTVVSSTAATESDPTLASNVQAVDRSMTSTMNAQSNEIAPEALPKTTESSPTVLIVEGSSEDRLGGQQRAEKQPSVGGGDRAAEQVSENTRPTEAKPSEEAVRETELEAVAAVDASIGFGDPFASMGDTCFDEYGNARYCEPEFENAAFERQVEVSSECGQPPSRFCTAYLNERGNDQIRNCHICDAQHPKKRHPASYLTDMNNSNNPTCWVSAPISSSQPTVANFSASEQPLRSDNVTLVLNLDKKYEITYVSMQFCSMKPDSLAILKSQDFGRTWQPYQYYSSQCLRMYGRQSGRATANSAAAAPANAQLGGQPEPSCVNSSQPGVQSSGRIAFSPLEGRGFHNLDRSGALQDWLSATNIKIVLDRHQSSWMHSSPNLGHSHGGGQSPGSANSSEAELENSLTSPSDTFNYAMSDLTVGGRCKCNGHASRCVHGKDGRLQCDCRHNTAGRDCERCAPFHFDRPWARATQFDANPCQPCNCNGHSRKCRFDDELYRLSGKRSGGVCRDCRDNTAGRHCHYCKEGFTRDHSKPMSDKEACKQCDCHPIGSLGRVCNQTTGQCPCKEGVTGLQCTRCSPGYQQSSSLSEPCIKLPENDINYEPSLTVQGVDEAQPSVGVQPSGDTQSELANEASGVELAPDSPRAPSAGSIGNKRKLAEQPEVGPEDQDPDKDQDVNGDAAELGLARKYRVQNWAHQRKQQQQQQQQQPYYRYHLQQGRRQFENGAEADEEEELNYPPMGSSRSQQPVYMMPSGYANAAGYPKRNFEYRPRRPAQSSGRRPEMLVPPIARLEPAAEQMNSLDELANNPNLNYPIYSEDFGQMQPRRQQQSRQRQQIASRDRYLPPNPDLGVAEQPSTCGDCQSGTRQLSFRQFCHLEFAIKATIIAKHVAEDWTQFELELQDIFKSPSSDSLLVGQTNANYIDNKFQSDETDLNQQRLMNRSLTETSSNILIGGEQSHSIGHRLKVGTVQSIWVPTEDLVCRCLKLRLRSTYLLMGSTDAKGNSASTLQLDRHGVALEWRSSLQEKLIKYQRRHSKGRC